MGQNYILEACVDSLDAALAAERAGADRIELCAGLELGGLSPSAGLIKAVSEALKIPVFVLLRPRAGDFNYSSGEFKSLLLDAESLAGLGAAGMVTGVLDADRNLDLSRMRELMAAGNLPVTFHRAFDHCQKAHETVEALVEMGVERILTSGQKASALLGAKLLWSLNEHFGDQICIMPGGGISAENIARIAQLASAREFHFSAIRLAEEHFEGPSLGKGGRENFHFVPYPEKVAAIRAAINQYQA